MYGWTTLVAEPVNVGCETVPAGVPAESAVVVPVVTPFDDPPESREPLVNSPLEAVAEVSGMALIFVLSLPEAEFRGNAGSRL
jgi:hypothetical protein